MQKIYCFVDESGQDTLGSFFTVAILVVRNKKEELGILIEGIENKTGKRNVKWNKAIHSRRIDYLNKLTSNINVKGNLYYSLYQSIGYDYFMILSIAKVINKTRLKTDQKVTIYVDALTKTKATKYGSELRKIGIMNCKVKGVKKDENNVFIRIVDSLAGFVRLALYKKDKEAKKMFNDFIQKKVLVEL